MTWKALLLAVVSFFGRSDSNELMLDKLERYNISHKPLVGATPDFIEDIPKKQRKKLRRTATADILIGLENPERFCQRLVTVRLSFCSKLDFRVELATRELINWKKNYDLGKFTYLPGKRNTIWLGIPSRFSTPKNFILTEGHESIHALIANDNLCHWSRTKNSNLTSNEKVLAPYDTETKAAFEQAILKGEERADRLNNKTKRTHLFYTDRKLINCLEEEAQAANTTLTQVMKILDQSTGIIKRQYEDYAKLYELIAAIFSVLADFPKLAAHLFPELRDILLKRIPEYKNCIDEIDPEWLSLSCNSTLRIG